MAATEPSLTAVSSASPRAATAVRSPSRRRPVRRALERRLEAALEIVASLTPIEQPADLARLVSGVEVVCAADAVHVYLDDGRTLRCAAHRVSGDSEPAGDGPACPDREAIARAIASREPSIVEPVVRAIHGAPAPPFVFVVPIVGGDVTHGALILERRPRFGPEDVIVMSVFAGLVAERFTSASWAVQADRQRRDVEQLLASQQRLLEINERLLSNLDPSGVLDLIADSLKALVAYDNLTIYRLDRQAGLLRAVFARDRFAELILGVSLSIDSGLTGWVCRHGAAECVNDAHLDPRGSLIAGTPAESESLVIVPLRVGGDVVGTLNIGRMGESEAHYSQQEFELIKLFAGQASIALGNAEAHRALQRRAETDSLTGLRNRGAFDDDLVRLLADPTMAPVALLMLDLDDFKHYNDRFGHPAGDRILKAVGSAINVIVGESGYRYGGDEFAIVVPRAAPADAAMITERVRLGLASLTRVGEPRLTASVGAAAFPADATTKDALVAAADAELYQNKAEFGARH